MSKRWDYNDYQKANDGKVRNHVSFASLISILAIIIAFIFAVVILITGAKKYILAYFPNIQISGSHNITLPNDKKEDKVESKEDIVIEEKENTKNYTNKTLNIVDRPVEFIKRNSEEGLSTVDIVKKVKPSVVEVDIYRKDINTDKQTNLTPDGYGSGVVMSEDGIIITNQHVINNATKVVVVFEDGSNYIADIIGEDEKTDLAVIKIEADNLNPAEFGNSDELEVGERVIEIGNSNGATLNGSVTQGIVSALGRDISSGTYSTTYIQTDAAINPGTSGGALINVYGQVVGISCAKIANVNYEGIGFAIPINEAKPIIDDLMHYGYVKGRVKIGITCSNIASAVAEINNVPVGVYINMINDGSDLNKTVTKAGDIITHIDGVRINSIKEMGNVLKEKNPDYIVTLTIFHPAKKKNDIESSFDVKIKLLEDINN